MMKIAHRERMAQSALAHRAQLGDHVLGAIIAAATAGDDRAPPPSGPVPAQESCSASAHAPNSAIVAGSARPAIKASNIARPETPIIALATEASLIPARCEHALDAVDFVAAFLDQCGFGTG